MRRSALACLIFSLPFYVYAQCATPDAEFKALRDYMLVSAAERAKIALAQNDTRFLGVAGFTLEVPGGDSVNCVVDRSSVVTLPATTDYVCDKAHQSLINQAEIYAKEYNTIIRAYLISKKALKCEH